MSNLHSGSSNELKGSAAVSTSSDPLTGAGDGYVASLLAQWFQVWGAPAFMVSTDLTLIAANAEGRRLLDEHGDIRLSEGRLWLSHMAQMDTFRAFLAGLGDAPKVWPVARSDEEGFWVLRAHRLTGTAGTAFSLVLTDSAAPPARFWADLSVPFLLTPAEERVARYLFEGQTATELAMTMGITVETARTYIRRIYLKTGASSREKLHSVLTPFQTV
ncbi:MAG: LuxR family transcriptional regulator [Brevundimonas sp.]|nr:MAG: LuxR family transcriptional regulator [Brevundimonas sp.]